MAEERVQEQTQQEKNQFLIRKLYNDKKHISIKDMMAYIDAYCPDKKDWFKALILETKTEGEGEKKKEVAAHSTLELKKQFYDNCVPKKEKEKKKSRREKLVEEMGW